MLNFKLISPQMYVNYEERNFGVKIYANTVMSCIKISLKHAILYIISKLVFTIFPADIFP